MQLSASSREFFSPEDDDDDYRSEGGVRNPALDNMGANAHRKRASDHQSAQCEQQTSAACLFRPVMTSLSSRRICCLRHDLIERLAACFTRARITINVDHMSSAIARSFSRLGLSA